jgi:hypothetical protein
LTAAFAESDLRSGCTNATLRGTYAFTARGTTFAALGLPAPLTGAYASSGTADFDGNGHFSLSANNSFNGVIQPAAVTGTYSVNRDCSYTSQASNGVTFRAAIVDGGNEIFILQTTRGTAIAGNARRRTASGSPDDDDRRTPAFCTPGSVAGSYGFVAEGAAGAPILPGVPFGPLTGVGTVTLNANGTFNMLAQRSVGGTIDPQPLPLSGRYAFSGNCAFRMTFDVVGFHFDATVVGRNEVRFLETDAGSALLVTAKRI